jgi:DNA polymerase
VRWQDPDAAPDLFGAAAMEETASDLHPVSAAPAPAWPAAFTREARAVLRHRDARRWDLLYGLAWRLASDGPRVLTNPVDPEVRRLHEWSMQVRRDVHKMHAFVRFRKMEATDGPVYVAWYRPDHLILPAVRSFFVERFGSMRWSILTPDGSLHWDGTACCSGPAACRQDAPDDDALEHLWRTYYGAIFNPARTNLRAMRREMPVRHWDLMPETRDIAALVARAPERTSAMVDSRSDATSARPFVPDSVSLRTLREASLGCKGCDLYRNATQTVFGEGTRRADVMLVGEQPGNEEDTRGEPFVGPAGRVLDEALAQADVPRSEVYVTNAVKHFKHESRGKWRIHKKPDASEVRACRPWLEAEIRSVKPKVIVCLGATAAQALLGPQARVGNAAAPVISPWAQSTLVTYHPSAVLRARDSESRDAVRKRLVHDLALARKLAAP